MFSQTQAIFGLLNILAIFTVTILANHHERITISPTTSKVVHFVNESYFVTCTGHKNMNVRWWYPNSDIVAETKGRVHVESMPPEPRIALIFEHIALADKGNWSCISDDGEHKKSFEMVVNQPISFGDTPILQSAREGTDATVTCQAKGAPEPTVSWYFNGEGINFSHHKFAKKPNGLLIKKVTKADSGEYTCRAFQVDNTTNTYQDQTIRLNIQHQPISGERKASADVQYGYVNGVVNLTCEAEAEPPANFVWNRNGKKITHKTHNIYTGNHTSVLQVLINDSKSFGDYMCKATNALGSIERTITLKEGVKPTTPTQFYLRGVNSDTFDIDVGAVRTSHIRSEMDINGYRFEFIPEEIYKAEDHRWDKARILNFGFEDGVTFLIKDLSPDTAYVVRVASRNPAGLSDWTEAKIFRTYQKEPIMNPTSGAGQLMSVQSISSMLFNSIVSAFVFSVL